jgi:hypothetical protein
MEVTELGGAYVTYADHLRAMTELEERLKSAVADNQQISCPTCNGSETAGLAVQKNGNAIPWVCGTCRGTGLYPP